MASTGNSGSDAAMREVLLLLIKSSTASKDSLGNYYKALREISNIPTWEEALDEAGAEEMEMAIARDDDNEVCVLVISVG